MTEPNEQLAAAQKGDINAFHQLFAEFQPQLKSYLYRLTANRNDADDLTHDTFVRAFDKCSTFKGSSSLKTWVFRIGTNLAMDALRQQKRWPVDAQDQSRAASQTSPQVIEAYLAINHHSPQGSYEIREHIDFCFTCLAKTLPIEQQIALILKDIYQFKVKEISLILDITFSQTQHALRNARQTMINIFDHRCSLVSKKGVCYQCSELNGLFNPKQDTQAELLRLEMVKAEPKKNLEELYELRSQLISHIDPLNANGTELHDAILQRIQKVIGGKMTLFKDEFGTISHDVDNGILTLTWSEKTAAMEDEDFQNSNLALAVLADEHKVEKIIVDVQHFGHSFGPDLGRWRNRNVLPIYARAGVTKMAFVHGPSYSGPEEGGMAGETFATRHFPTKEAALAWLQ